MAMVRPAGGGDGIVTTTAQRRKCAADPREGCAVTTNLIEPGELGRHRADPDWAIIDCRFELARPDWGEQAFAAAHIRSEEHTSELQSLRHLVCRLLLEKKKQII